MEDGGTDLENFKIKNMKQMLSITNQLVNALSLAEDCIQFEHRDLHLGNILVKETKAEFYVLNNEKFCYDGIQCNIIDYSLSRMRHGNSVAFRDLDAIGWLFEGDSHIDLQYQVYKDMLESRGSRSWQEFNPRSNVLWLSFVIGRLLQNNILLKRSTKIYDKLIKFHKQILKYSSVQELKESDEFFKK